MKYTKLILILIISFMITGCSASNNHKNKVEAPKMSKIRESSSNSADTTSKKFTPVINTSSEKWSKKRSGTLRLYA